MKSLCSSLLATLLFPLQAGNMICEWAVALTMEGKATSSCISFPPLPLPSPSYPFPPPGYFCGILSSQSKLREREKQWGEQCLRPYFADSIHTPYSENTVCMWVSDPCRFLLFIAISINTDLHTAGFTQCCVSCKLNRFDLCYGLEVASASSKVKIGMKESSARAMVTLPQGRLLSWENAVVTLAEDKACSAISVFWCPGDFCPLCYCACMCMRHRCFSVPWLGLMTAVWVGACNHRTNVLHLPCLVLPSTKPLFWSFAAAESCPVMKGCWVPSPCGVHCYLLA